MRRAGEALHPEREPLTVLEQQRAELGPDLFAAQYQQSPVPPGGAMIRKVAALLGHPSSNPRAKNLKSWDTAAKDGPQNNWSVCTTWILVGDDFYLIDLVRGRYLFHELQGTAIALAQRYHPQWVLIEDASTGTALAEMLKRSYFGGAVKLVPVERDKIGRLYVHQAKFAAGRVLFPRNAPFLPQLETELLSFPQGKTDDIVDSISQALSFDPLSFDSTFSWV